MPKFVFEITEEEWQRFSHVLNMSYVNEDDDKKGALAEVSLATWWVLVG